MCSGDEFKIIKMIKLADDLGSEQPAGASGAELPSKDIFRVGPHHVAERPIIGNFFIAVNQADLVNGSNVGREPPMDTKYRILNQSCNWQIVKDIGEIFPWVDITVFLQNFVVKSVSLGDLTGLVVASEEADKMGVFEFQTEEILESFDRMVASINEISNEYVFLVRDFTSDPE